MTFKERYNRYKTIITDNLPTVIVTATSIAVVGLAIKTANDAEEASRLNKDILASIEEKISTAIEAPTIVKVELGDEIELIGRGNRTD